MNEERISGAIKNATGKLEEGFGKLAGDDGTRLRGEARQIEGKVQGFAGKAVDEACRFFDRHPLVSLLAIGSLALAIIPTLTGGRRD